MLLMTEPMTLVEIHIQPVSEPVRLVTSGVKLSLGIGY